MRYVWPDWPHFSVILMVRTYALYNCDKRILALFVLVAAVGGGVGCVSSVPSHSHATSDTPASRSSLKAAMMLVRHWTLQTQHVWFQFPIASKYNGWSSCVGLTKDLVQCRPHCSGMDRPVQHRFAHIPSHPLQDVELSPTGWHATAYYSTRRLSIFRVWRTSSEFARPHNNDYRIIASVNLANILTFYVSDRHGV
jgi:hypothetical protein